MTMECIVCGNDSFPIFTSIAPQFANVNCCNLEFAVPMPSDAVLEKLYSDYVYYTEYDREMIRDTVRKNNRKNIEYLSRYGLSKEQKLLDFGCGENLFVMEGGFR